MAEFLCALQKKKKNKNKRIPLIFFHFLCSRTRNGVEVIADNKHIKIYELEDGTSVLLIDSSNRDRDALQYKAVATNEAGEAETSASLTVTPATIAEAPEERPLFLHGLKDVITDEGQPLIIEAPFTGNPIPSVEWTKDGEPLRPTDRILLTCDGKKVKMKINIGLLIIFVRWNHSIIRSLVYFCRHFAVGFPLSQD